MNITLLDMFQPLIEEIKYLKNIQLKRRGSFQILKISINEIMNPLSEKYSRNCLEILDHAFYPLLINLYKYAKEDNEHFLYNKKTLQIIQDEDLYISKLDELVKMIIELIVSLENKYNSGTHVENGSTNQKNSTIEKLSKLIGHCVQHIGQVIMIQGMIIEMGNI